MQFKPVTVDDYPSLKKYFEKQSFELSTYSLFSIIVWSSQHLRTFFAVENDALVILNELDNQHEERHLILPLSITEAITPVFLYNLAKKTGIRKYCFVPGTFLSMYDQNQIKSYFTVSEQPEFDDYIYLMEDLVHLKGNKFAKQRNLISQFRKTHLSKGTVRIETITSDNYLDCMEFLKIWCVQHNCDLDGNEGLACEKIATINALKNLDRMDSKGILIRIDGVVSAFGICSHLTRDMGILNFEKAFSNIKGLYQFLDNECAKRLFSSYKYINKESDMSLPNLAQSKNSYNPVMKLKSYCLTVVS
jgi:hypothetical protein